jgi:hypothetical protein
MSETEITKLKIKDNINVNTLDLCNLLNIDFAPQACIFVKEKSDRIDNVLKKILPLYAKKYCIPCITNNLKDYSYYRDIVDKILEKSGNKISRNGFDHLLWYYHKGRL